MGLGDGERAEEWNSDKADKNIKALDDQRYKDCPRCKGHLTQKGDKKSVCDLCCRDRWQSKAKRDKLQDLFRGVE